MKIQIETPADIYTTPEGSVRQLEYEWEPIHIIDHLFEPGFVEGLGAVLIRLPSTVSDYDTEARGRSARSRPDRPVLWQCRVAFRMAG